MDLEDASPEDEEELEELDSRRECESEDDELEEDAWRTLFVTCFLFLRG